MNVVMTEKKPSNRYKNTFTQTDVSALIALKKKYGVSTAAEMVGMSASGYHNCISKSKCSISVARLAEQLLKNSGEQFAGDKIWVVKVPNAKKDIVREVLTSLGARIAFVGDN